MEIGLGGSPPPIYGACVHGLSHEPPPYARLFGYGPPSYANAIEFEIGLLPPVQMARGVCGGCQCETIAVKKEAVKRR